MSNKQAASDLMDAMYEEAQRTRKRELKLFSVLAPAISKTLLPALTGSSRSGVKPAPKPQRPAQPAKK